MTRVLVVYASRHGATKGIAMRIAATLKDEGFTTTTVSADEAPQPGHADAVVIGSAAYMGKWLEPATDYVHRHHDALATRPTWLFSSGPIGTEMVDKQGHSVLEAPKQLREISGELLARGSRVFFGRWDPSDPPATLAERLFKLVPVSKDVLPIGDFRDWEAIEAWAHEIAEELRVITAEDAVPAGAAT
jgi:menaquinone-dependent protoporphyrinogen oxidase